MYNRKLLKEVLLLSELNTSAEENSSEPPAMDVVGTMRKKITFFFTCTQ